MKPSKTRSEKITSLLRGIIIYITLSVVFLIPMAGIILHLQNQKIEQLQDEISWLQSGNDKFNENMFGYQNGIVWSKIVEQQASPILYCPNSTINIEHKNPIFGNESARICYLIAQWDYNDSRFTW